MNTIEYQDNIIKELKKRITYLERNMQMFENKKLKVMETFRNAKKKRDMLLNLFEDFTRESNIYDYWLEYRKRHSLKRKFKRLDER